MVDHPQKTEVRSLLEVSIALISLSASASVLMSSIYNWAYFEELGFVGADMLTPTDILVSSIAWLPYPLLGYFIGQIYSFFQEMLLTKIEAPYAENPTFIAARRARMDRVFRNLTWMFLVLTIILFLTTPPGNWAVIMGLFPLWLLLAVEVMETQFSKKNLSATVRFAVTYIPPICMFIFFDGTTAAQSAVAGTNNPKIVTVDLNETNKMGSVIRTMERGVILQQTNSSKIDFVTWEHVKQIEMTVVTPQTSSRFCQWTSGFCITAQNGWQTVSPSTKPKRP